MSGHHARTNPLWMHEATSLLAAVLRKNPDWDREHNSLYLSLARTPYGTHFREHFEPIGDEL